MRQVGIRSAALLALVLLAAIDLIGCSEHPPNDDANSRFSVAETEAWRARAQDISIVRDDWGIPHIHGKTDSDAVFGLIYAQAEDDFNRIETNFLISQGRLAEAEGEQEIWRDLRMKMYIDPEDIKRKFDASPDWLKELMQAWADGLNFFLASHPDVKPRVLNRFEPWMALTFSEGSIGGDIERISLKELAEFYRGAAPPDERLRDQEPKGSNGFAIAPSNSKSKHALLWINPHTSFFFRAEAQVTSDTGLNAYGAITWGQFFVYQGFNEHAGWMHTSSGVDNIDEYLESVTRDKNGLTYRYGAEDRPLSSREATVRYKTSNGLAEKKFTIYRSHHGPIVRETQGKWVSVHLMEDPVHALTQSFLRTKTNNLEEFKSVLDLHTNSSNNTVFADSQGNIAYFHANYIPKRDAKFDWTQPVDGTNPATDWQGVMSIDESPHVINPKSGWLYNTNNSPWTAAGEADSPKEKSYPAYVESFTQNPRGVHAIRVLSGKKDFTPESLIAAAFNPELPELELLVPKLVKAHASLPQANPLKAKLAAPIATLKDWKYRWSSDSIATSLAVLWAEALWVRVGSEADSKRVSVYDYMERLASDAQCLDAFATVIDKLTTDFGKWQTPWGDINRFQRLTDDIVQPFDDAAPSIAVPFTSARWGSLASYGARPYRGSKKLYGTTGNSFLAVVEFGEKVQARAITAGGQSGDPRSKHFNDQAERYAHGDLREVYFYPEQLQGHTERSYHPGM